MSDNVEKPAHYNQGSVETIDGIRAALGDSFLDYCRGNVLKYVWRCQSKGKLLEDLQKAAKYLEWAIAEAEKREAKSDAGNCPEIPEGWRELEQGEVPSIGDKFEDGGKWLDRVTSTTYEYRWFAVRHIRKIEPNSSETPNSSTWAPKVGDKVRAFSLEPTEDAK